MAAISLDERPSASLSAEQRPRAGALPLISSLYVTQYLGVGFIYVGLTAVLRSEGVSLESLALVGLAGMSWALKPLWAPLVDRYGRTPAGHYRNWLLILQPLLALAGLSLVALPEPAQHLGLLGALILVYTLVSATQDIAADGLTARAVDDESRPMANGLANAAQWVGNVLGGGLIVLVYDAFGWIPAMLLLTALSLLPLPMLLRHREIAPSSPPSNLASSYRALVAVFRQPRAVRWGLVAMPMFMGGTTAAYGLLSPALTDAGWPLGLLGLVLGMGLAVPAAIASIAIGPIVRRFGQTRALLVTGLLTAVATLMLIPLITGDAPVWPTLLTLSLYVGAMAGSSTLVYTVNMSLARDGSEATDFTTLAAIAILASYVLGAALMYAAGSFGYASVLGACAALATVGTLVAVWATATTERRAA